MSNNVSLRHGLIIFVRNIIPGKVKTRLAKTLGDENALKIYRKLLDRTFTITNTIPVDKFVFYSDFIENDDIWMPNVFKKAVQSGAELGARMGSAFEKLFDSGYTKLVIIGSDCFDLTESIITTAFNQLEESAVVIGPATDGGYYLLGMNCMIPQLFEQIQWGSSNVFGQTIAAAGNLDYSVKILPVLSDIDEEKDVDFPY